MKLEEKLGVYTSTATGVKEFISQSRKKLAALRLLKDCDEAKFALLEKGPSVLNVKGMGLVADTLQPRYHFNNIFYKRIELAIYSHNELANVPKK